MSYEPVEFRSIFSIDSSPVLNMHDLPLGSLVPFLHCLRPISIDRLYLVRMLIGLMLMHMVECMYLLLDLCNYDSTREVPFWET